MEWHDYGLILLHGCILVFVGRRLSRKSKRLEKEKAELHVENLQLQGKLGFYERYLNDLPNDTAQQ